MPYLGLVLTSLGFLVPGWVAWRRGWGSGRRGQPRSPGCALDTLSSVLVATTSVFYHGTLHPVAQRIDIVVAHGMGVLSVGRSLFQLATWRRGWVELWIAGGTLGSIGVYLFKSRNNPHLHSRYWHMLFHLGGQATWLTHVLTN